MGCLWVLSVGGRNCWRFVTDAASASSRTACDVVVVVYVSRVTDLIGSKGCASRSLVVPTATAAQQALGALRQCGCRCTALSQTGRQKRDKKHRLQPPK